MQAGGTDTMRKIGSITLLDVEEVSKKLGITTKTVIKLINDGELPARKLGKSWFVSDRKLQEFVETPENVPEKSAEKAQAEYAVWLLEYLEESGAIIAIPEDPDDSGHGEMVHHVVHDGQLIDLADLEDDEDEAEDSDEEEEESEDEEA